MRYFLDTNICIYIIKKHPEEVIKTLKKHKIATIAISSITLAELQYGVEKSADPIRNRFALNQFLAPFEIAKYDQKAAMVYGKIQSVLEKNGMIIGPLDLLIAAHCLSNNCTLVTNNEKEFSRVKDLKIVNWVGK